MRISKLLALLSVSSTFALLNCARTDNTTGSEVKIFNGEDEEGSFSVVKILKDQKVLCTGNLIEKNMVLTASHCFGGNTNNASSYTVEVADPEELRGDEKIKGQRIEAMDYRWKNNVLVPGSGADVAILVLERPTSYTINMPPILDQTETDALVAQNTQNRVRFTMDPNKTFSIVGYGISTDTGQASDYYTAGTKRKATVPMRSYWGLDNEEFHIGIQKYHACNGDSGGPLYALKDQKKYLVGLSSRSFTYDEDNIMTICKQTDGSIYTNITKNSVRQWITNIVNRNHNN